MLLKSQFNRLLSENIFLSVPVEGGGWHMLSTYSMYKRWIKSRVEFGAFINGVSITRFKLWKAFYDNPQCTGLTKSGSQCQHAGLQDPTYGPTKFIPGKSDRCAIHGGER